MPDDRCDEGYILESGIGCVRPSDGGDAEVTADIPLIDAIADGFTNDSLEDSENSTPVDPYSTLGDPCKSDADCIGPSAICVIHELIPAPFCSVIGCHVNPNDCPTGFICYDVSSFGFPGNICISESLLP